MSGTTRRGTNRSQEEPDRNWFDLSIGGFKSIGRRQTVRLRPLTLLAGANSSGKSSAVQPLLLLKQTWEAGFSTSGLRLDGTCVRFSAADQLFTRDGSPEPDVWTVGVRHLHGRSNVEIGFRRTQRGPGVEPGHVTLDGVTIGPEMGGAALTTILGEPPPLDPAEETGAMLADVPSEWGVDRRSFFLIPIAGRRGAEPRDAAHWLRAYVGLLRIVESLVYLPGLRGNPERSYSRAAVPAGGSLGKAERYPGHFQPYVANLVARWQDDDDDRIEQLGEQLHQLGLTSRVAARPIDDVSVSLQVNRLPPSGPGDDLVDISDVGPGVSQVLPVLVALLAAGQGQVVLLEQPELHLHPRAQRALAHVLVAAAGRGVLVVAETHSSLILREVQTLVAQGDLDPSAVALHWFSRDPTSGLTDISIGELDESGAFGDWPEDFDDVALAADAAYLDAVADRDAR